MGSAAHGRLKAPGLPTTRKPTPKRRETRYDRKAPDQREEIFVREYLVDLNGSRAAKAAGYCPASEPKVMACKLLARPHIQEQIQRAMEERAKRVDVTADRVLLEIARLGFSDLRRIFTPDGAMLRPEDWDDATAAAISSVKVVTRQTGEKDENGRPVVERVHEIKLWDKTKPLEMLARHLNMDAGQDPAGRRVERLLSAMTEEELVNRMMEKRALRLIGEGRGET